MSTHEMDAAVKSINNRIAIVAGTYSSLMEWAIKVEIVPAGTSLNIRDYLSLPQATFEAATTTGLPNVVAEYKGLTTALNIIEYESRKVAAQGE